MAPRRVPRQRRGYIGSKIDDLKKEPDKPNAVSVMTDTESIQQIMQRGMTKDIHYFCCCAINHVISTYRR